MTRSFLSYKKKRYPTLRQRADICRVTLRRNIIMALPFVKKKVIMSRTACFGKDLIDLKFGTKNVFIWNQQKTRADVFMEYINGATRPKWRTVAPFLKRNDVWYLIEQQELLPWLHLRKTPDYIIMDSLAELTDKKITHKKEGWSFCSHISDLDITSDFNEIFTIEGLLSEEKLEESYSVFFEWIAERYKKMPIYFIHYPTTFDPRDLYKRRGKLILEIMQKLAKKDPFIHNIFLDDSRVFPYEYDSYPYHYSSETNLEFKKLLDEDGRN